MGLSSITGIKQPEKSSLLKSLKALWLPSQSQIHTRYVLFIMDEEKTVFMSEMHIFM